MTNKTFEPIAWLVYIISAGGISVIAITDKLMWLLLIFCVSLVAIALIAFHRYGNKCPLNDEEAP